MAKNLVNGTNIIIEESGDNINMNLSSSYNTNLQQEINNSFKKNNIYSTNEMVVGKWIDGKPIYRKAVPVTVTQAGPQNVNHGISDVDRFISYGGSFKRRGGSTQVIPALYTNWEVWIYDFGTTSFIVRTSSNQFNAGVNDFYVVLEYTKTTDVVS